jgi:hypothetical protein
MEMRMDGGREFWRGVLVAGGFTAIPRWTCNPVTDVVEHEPTIPDDLAATLRRLADELAVPLRSVLLAAHAKVLAALSGGARGRDRLRRRAGRPARTNTALPADHPTRLVADVVAGHPSSRVKTAVAPGLPGR